MVSSIARRGEQLLADLRVLVNIPTGPGGGGVEECRGLLGARLTALGADCEMVPGSEKDAWLDGPVAGRAAGEIPATAVYRRRKAGKRSAMLCGHIDTVHEANSSFRTLEISADRRTVTGPGCVDMKGGLLIAVAALEALEECGVETSWGFAINADEETGSYHSEAALRAEAAHYDFGLVFEPAMTDGGLVVSRPGSGQFMIETHGKAGHVGRDFKNCVSAVNALADRILKAAALAKPDAGAILNIGPLRGGAATNIVPDHAAAWGNVRFTTQAASEELAKGLDALATDAAAMPRVTVRRSFSRPLKPLTPGTEKLALAARSAAEDLGQSLPFGTTGGVCDGNNMQAAGLATIDTLGVRGGGLHTTGEWVEVASLVERCQLAAVLMSRLA